QVAPDWELANATRDPSFAVGIPVDTTTSAVGIGWFACGDVDNDGNPDAVLLRCSSASATFCNVPDRHVIYYGNGLGGLRETKTALKVASRPGKMYKLGTKMALYDITGDGYKDLIIGAASNGGGKVIYIAAT